MKMLFVVYSASLEFSILSALEKCGLKNYTKMENILGVGSTTEPKLNTGIWPGTNNAMFIALGDSCVPNVLGQMRQIKQTHKNEGIKCFVSPLEEVV